MYTATEKLVASLIVGVVALGLSLIVIFAETDAERLARCVADGGSRVIEDTDVAVGSGLAHNPNGSVTPTTTVTTTTDYLCVDAQGGVVWFE